MKHIPVIVFGAGGVGRALLRQIVATRAQVTERVHCHFDVVAVVDRHHWLWRPLGLQSDQIFGLLADKEAGKAIGQERPAGLKILAESESAGLERTLVIDVTASDEMEPIIDRAADLGYGVVLANKKPLAGPWQSARRYFNQPWLRYESTVGGGQPVIAALRYLVDTGDPIYRIEGQMSGTLAYICSRLDKGDDFSAALRDAKAAGITEPDPREDLGGRDVMRKVMILGRLAGWPLEERDIRVETLYHDSLSHLTVPEFMDAAVAMDHPLSDRVQAAADAGLVLRFVAEVKPDEGTVGLKPLSREDPLAKLKYIAFHTERYQEEPLMIAGKGAGIEMTAAGVLGDMVALTRERW